MLRDNCVRADDVAADDGQQRKRRGRIGNMAAEPSASMKDSLGNPALEPAENMLADGLDGDRSSGEMLMECVVKVRISRNSRVHFIWSRQHLNKVLLVLHTFAVDSWLSRHMLTV